MLRWLPNILIGNKGNEMIKIFPKTYDSFVPNHETMCVAVWLNRNQICNRLDGGVTGFFKAAERIFPGVYITKGKEFHGILRGGVHPTQSL